MQQLNSGSSPFPTSRQYANKRRHSGVQKVELPGNDYSILLVMFAMTLRAYQVCLISSQSLHLHLSLSTVVDNSQGKQCIF
eukprot:1159171-Pelagomonas_calceolata.AAC.3